MTTVVKKGAGRPAAAARKRKHDQRTPLPPKKEQIDDAKEVIAKVKPETKTDRMARNFANFAIEHGWGTDIQIGAYDRVAVKATKDDQTIVITYMDGKLDGDNMPYWENGWRKRFMRNDAETRRQIALPDDQKPIPLAVKRAPAKRTEPDPEPASVLPFDPDAATGTEILAALRGREIAWRNGTAREAGSATVPRTGVKVARHPQTNDRMVVWGSTAVLLRKITRVG